MPLDRAGTLRLAWQPGKQSDRDEDKRPTRHARQFHNSIIDLPQLPALRHRIQDERGDLLVVERGQLLHEGGWPALHSLNKRFVITVRRRLEAGPALHQFHPACCQRLRFFAGGVFVERFRKREVETRRGKRQAFAILGRKLLQLFRYGRVTVIPLPVTGESPDDECRDLMQVEGGKALLCGLGPVLAISPCLDQAAVDAGISARIADPQCAPSPWPTPALFRSRDLRGARPRYRETGRSRLRTAKPGGVPESAPTLLRDSSSS